MNFGSAWNQLLDNCLLDQLVTFFRELADIIRELGCLFLLGFLALLELLPEFHRNGDDYHRPIEAGGDVKKDSFAVIVFPPIHP